MPGATFSYETSVSYQESLWRVECRHAKLRFSFHQFCRENPPSPSRQSPLFRFIRLHPSFIHLSQKYFKFELQNKNSTKKKHQLQINKTNKEDLHIHLHINLLETFCCRWYWSTASLSSSFFSRRLWSSEAWWSTYRIDTIFDWDWYEFGEKFGKGVFYCVFSIIF